MLAKKGIAKTSRKDVNSQPKFMVCIYTINGMGVCQEYFKSVFLVCKGRLRRMLQSYDKDPNELAKNKSRLKEKQGINERVLETIT